MLYPALEMSWAAFWEAYEELASQEWITSQYDRDLETTFLEVDANLLPRLLHYYRHPSRQKCLNVAQPRLANCLAELVEELSLNQLHVVHVEAALRLLPIEAGASLWEIIVQRIAREANWSRARRIAERILGESRDENEVVETLAICQSLKAAIEAVLVSTLIHENSDSTLIEGFWSAIAQTATDYPLSNVSCWLEQRAVVGGVAAVIRSTTGHLADEQVLRLWLILEEFPPSCNEADRFYIEQLAASLCAAVEMLAELSESSQDLSLIPEPSLLEAWVQKLEVFQPAHEILAFAYMLAGWVMALHKQWQGAKQMLEQAVVALPSNNDRFGVQCWLDWRVPDSLSDRIRLEALRLLPPWIQSMDQGQMQSWRQAATNRLQFIDAERLTSLSLDLQLHQEPLSAAELTVLTELDRYELARRKPMCIAHRAVPPLFVTLAFGWLAIGHSERALLQLNQRLSEATTNRDPHSVRAAERAILRVVRRQRLYGEGQAIATRFATSDDSDDTSLALSLMSVNYSPPSHAIVQPQQDAPPATIHAWWSSHILLFTKPTRKSIDTSAVLIQHAIQTAVHFNATLEQFALELDLQEVALIAETIDRPIGWIETSLHPMALLTYDLAQMEKGLRLMLRQMALAEQESFNVSWIEQVGWRWLAELALEEGELLALRLPQLAVRLLDLAQAWFEYANDPVGNTIATIRSAIATIHARNIDAAEAKLQSLVQPNYQRLQRALEACLPDWTELVNWRDERNLADLPTLDQDDPEWAGWLHRLFSCITWQAEPRRRGQRTSKLQNWLSNRYGKRLPIELNLLPTDRSRISKDQTITAWTAATLNIALLPSYNARSPELTTLAPIVIQSKVFDLVGCQSLLDEIEVESYTPSLRSYYRAATEIPEEIVSQLHELQALPKEYRCVCLRIEAAIAAHPWEAILTLALSSQSDGAFEESLQFWRFGEALPNAASAKVGWHQGAIYLLSSQTWERTMSHEWKYLASQVIAANNPNQLRKHLKGARTSGSADIKLLHLIGTPVQTSGGIQLQLNDRWGENQLVRADSLPLDLSALIIVQAEPAEIPKRLETDREQAACLRAYAAEIFMVGAQAVIMIPALPSLLAARVVNILSQRLHPKLSPDLWDLLTVVDVVKNTIWQDYALSTLSTTDSATDVSENAIESTLDVCLFARLLDQDAKIFALVERQLSPNKQLSKRDLERLKGNIRDASASVKRYIFERAKRLRQDNWRHNKPLMEKTIPIFQALIACDFNRKFHTNYGQLGYALKDKHNPSKQDWIDAESALSIAIRIRDQQRQAGFLHYELNRAICRIMLDTAFQQREPASPKVRSAILIDLRAAEQDSKLGEAIRKENEPGVFNPIPEWRRLNDQRSI